MEQANSKQINGLVVGSCPTPNLETSIEIPWTNCSVKAQKTTDKQLVELCLSAEFLNGWAALNRELYVALKREQPTWTSFRYGARALRCLTLDPNLQEQVEQAQKPAVVVASMAETEWTPLAPPVSGQQDSTRRVLDVMTVAAKATSNRSAQTYRQKRELKMDAAYKRRQEKKAEHEKTMLHIDHVKT